jgi:hypothetical protein
MEEVFTRVDGSVHGGHVEAGRVRKGGQRLGIALREDGGGAEGRRDEQYVWAHLFMLDEARRTHGDKIKVHHEAP